MTDNNPQQLVFIDSRVPDLQDLLDGVQPDEQAFVLDPSSDGMEQIADVLAANNFTNLSSISIVSHGASGTLDLGSSAITDANLNAHSNALAEIGASLAPGGTIQLYGCDVAQGPAGQQFINDFSTFAGGAQVDASTQPVGSASFGGSWTLNAASQGGAAPTSVVTTPFASTALANFQGALGAPSDPELWIASDLSGGDILHVDDVAGSATNSTTLYTGNTALTDIQDVVVDPTDQVYFFVRQNPNTGEEQILEGSLVQALSNPTAAPTFTTIFTDTSVGAGTIHPDFIPQIALDTVSHQIYFVDDFNLTTGTNNIEKFERVNYSDVNSTTATTLATVVAQTSGGPSVEVTGFALDLTNHVAVFAVNQGGSISFTHTSAPQTFLYEATGVSSAATSVAISQLPIGGATNFTFNPSMGFFDNAFPGGIAIDRTTHKLYFTLENGLTGGGLYEYDLTGNPNGNITTIWAQNSGGPTGAPNALVIDPTTGEYFIAFDGGTAQTTDQFNGVWRGLLASTAAPTAFLTSPTFPANGDHVPLEFWLDQQPTLAITALTPTWTEEGSNVSLISAATATDPDNGELVSATVSISGGFFTQGTTGDTLTDTTTGNITSSYNSSTGILTLSGVDSFSNYDAVLKSVQYHGGENPTHFGSDNSRTLTWVVNDGLITSAPQTSSVSVLFVNDPPTLSSVATSAHYTEEQSPFATLAAALSVVDVDDLNLSSATVQITGGTFAGDGDVLAATAVGNVTVSYNSSTETLTLSGADTLAHYQSVLDSVTFHAGENPTNFGSNPTRTITWVAMDPSGTTLGGQDTSAFATTTVTITNVNDAPTLALGATVASWTEEQASPTSLAPAATITDPDDLNLVSATVKITGGTFAGDSDVLSATPTGNITVSYNSSSESLILTGSDTLADYVTVLNSVTFNAGENPTDFGSAPTRTLVWILNDGGGTANGGVQLSTAQTTTINITSINDAPTLTNVATSAQYTEHGGAVTLSGGVSIIDVDDLKLSSATIKITGGTFAGDGDVLASEGVSNGVIGGTAITASYNSSTETLTLTGTDTLAAYKTALDDLTFISAENPTNFGSNPTRTVTWQVMDPSGTALGGSDTSALGTTTVTITNVNDAPTLALGATTASWTEEGSTTTLAPAASVTDPDNQKLVSATVQITGGTFAGDSDVLSATPTGNITVSYNSSSETLTLTGSDTLANYQSVLDSVTFNAGENPTDFGSNLTRTLTWTLNDGSASFATGTATSTISITNVNDAPTLSNVAPSVLATPGSTVVLSSNVTITDPDSNKMFGATVQIAGGTFAGDGDVLAATATGNVTVSYNSSNETLILSGTDSLANYQTVLDSVAWHSTAGDPTNSGSNPTRTITWVVNDGGSSFNLSSAQTETLIIDTPPTLSGLTASASWTEHTAATVLSPNVTIADPDGVSTQLSATVKIVGGTFTGDGDVLSATATGNVTVSYNSSTETLTITGSDSLANYQTVLDSVTFQAGENPTDFGSNPSRTLTWTVADHVGSESAPVSTTVNITNVNDPPALANVATAAFFTEHGSSVALSSAVSVTDPDDLNLSSATVQITGGTFSGDGDVLAATAVGNVTVSYNSSTETLTLTGSDALANYQTVLDSVTFNAGENPTDFGSFPTRTVVWTLNDGSGTANGGSQVSTPVTSAISITNINDAPTLSNVATSASFTEEGGAVTLSSAVSVSDPDDLNLSGATVKIVGGTFAGDGDVLSATGTASIAVSYNSSTETLTLSGTDTLAHYQSVLDSVTFNAGENPNNYGSNPTRTLTWTLMDPGGTANGGANLSTPATTTVSITNVNDPPALGNVATSAFFTEHGAAVTLSSAVSASDPDNLNLVGATVKITGGTFTGDGDVLSASGTASIAVSYNSSSETLTLTGTDTLAHYAAVLDTVTFAAGPENPTNFGSNPTRTVTWQLNDGSGSFNLSTAVTETVSITNINDAPTLANVATTAAFTEEGGAVTLSSAVSVSDPDDVNLSGATVKITGGTFAGDGDVLAANTAGTSIVASYNSSTETLTLAGSDTLAHYQSVLDTVTFNGGENPTNYGSNPTRTLTWTLTDPSGTANGGVNVSTPVTTAVNITNVNDAPTLSNVAPLVGFVPQHTITISPATSVSDPDNLTLTNATVKITGGSFAGDGDVLAANVAGTGITSSYNSSTETLTLSGTDTLAHYQSVLDSVTFSSGSNPSNGNLNRTRTVSWVVNDGSGSNNLSTAATTTISIGGSVRNDFDGDNKSDLLLQNVPFAGNPNVMVELLNGTTIVSSGTITTPNGWVVEASGDFNHDNKADIILQNNGLPQIWLMNGTSVTSTVTLVNPGPSWHVIATGDFNGDGNADILWQNNDGAAAIWLMNGTTPVAGGVLPVNPGPAWHLIGAGDVNGDGKADLLWQNNDGTPAIWEMNGTNAIGGGLLLNPGASWHAIGLGDFNGDGKADILWQNADGAAAIWELNGTSIIGGGILSPNPGPSWHVIGPSDFNGDGLSDIVWQNNDGTPAIWDMNGTSIIGGGLLPNPGATWHVKDDGPISPDPAGAGAQPPALHLSTPDAANAVPMRSAPDGAAGAPGAAGFALAPDGSPAQLAPTWSSLAGQSGDPTWMRQMHAGTS